MRHVFAYGSLMGDAVLGRYAARPARLDGFHRAFVHESRKRWGSPESPCPILGLTPGGECWGLAFEVPDTDERMVLRALERREAAVERRCETRAIDTPGGSVDCWVWVSPDADGGEPEASRVEERLRSARGVVGTGVEYVRTVAHAMEMHGIRDPLVEHLWGRLR